MHDRSAYGRGFLVGKVVYEVETYFRYFVGEGQLVSFSVYSGRIICLYVLEVKEMINMATRFFLKVHFQRRSLGRFTMYSQQA